MSFLYLFENWFISVCDFQGTMHSENMMHQMLASVSSSYFCCIVCLHTTEKLLLRGALYCMRQTHIFSDWHFISHWKQKAHFSSSITGKTSYHNSTSLLIGLTPVHQFSSFTVLFPTELTYRCLFLYEQATHLFFSLIRRPPALPHRLHCSTIGRSGLNRRVRDGNGCFP